jgi:hypothetical protein
VLTVRKFVEFRGSKPRIPDKFVTCIQSSSIYERVSINFLIIYLTLSFSLSFGVNNIEGIIREIH